MESESESRSVMSDFLQPMYSPWIVPMYSPRNSPGQNTGVGSLSLLQGMPAALQADSLPTELSGKPYIYIYIKSQMKKTTHY